MIDHVLGRPSVKSRRLQVLAVLAFWTTYLVRGNKHGPPFSRYLSRVISKHWTAWQTVVLTMMYLYTARNFSTLVGLASPDPLSNMYEATFFRATWVLTALDAGFWTAMRIRTRWLRDIASIAFSGFYLIAAEKADEKVRKVRGNLTVEHLRVSWNKGTTPYLGFLQGLMRPRLTRWPPRRVRIPRPATSDYKDQPIMAWLYYDGSIDHLRASGINRIILDIPGGGFVAMDPRCNDDRLFSWAVQTGLPVLSLDYKKAPEFPFPHALNECYDTYATLVNTRGRCIGLAAQDPVRIVVAGDSAGGNLAAGMTLMLAQSAPPLLAAQSNGSVQEQGQLPMPEGLLLTYPSLDVNIGNWMSDEQMALIKDRRSRKTNKGVIRRKTNQYSDIAGTPHESDDEDLQMTMAGPTAEESRSSSDDEQTARARGESARSPKPVYSHVNVSAYNTAGNSRPQTPGNGMMPLTPTAPASYHPEAVSTRLTTSSTISYFNDRVLTPEMMRAMIILYVGPHNRPDFSKDYLLSPILAPDLLLAHFPKTYFLTGERDPLVDDTVIFAGRLRRIKAAYYASGGRRLEYRELDASAEGFDDRDVAEVVLIPGVSHGFLQFPTIYPPAWKWIKKSAQWIEDAFQNAEEMRTRQSEQTRPRGRTRNMRGSRQPASQAGPLNADHTNSTDRGSLPSGARTESSGEEDGPLEMMRMTKVKGKQPVDNKPKTVPIIKGPSTGKESSADAAVASSTATAPESALSRPKGRNEGDVEDGKLAKKKRAAAKQRAKDDKNLIKLASSEDLLGRRMQGIVGGLSGVTEE